MKFKKLTYIVITAIFISIGVSWGYNWFQDKKLEIMIYETTNYFYGTWSLESTSINMAFLDGTYNFYDLSEDIDIVGVWRVEEFEDTGKPILWLNGKLFWFSIIDKATYQSWPVGSTQSSGMVFRKLT